MKILKFSGIVAAIHLLVVSIALTNPGCSSSSKPAPSPSETEPKVEAGPVISAAPSAPPAAGDMGNSASAPIAFNPAGATPRYSPTRPGTPVAASLQTEPVANVTPASTYTVVMGDSLSLIAKKNHIAAGELAAANNLNLNSAKIRPGQKLIIPAKSTAAATPGDKAAAPTTASSAVKTADATVSKSSPDQLTYTVQAGDTLGAIAHNFGVKPADIAVANSISDPKKLPAGKVLIIPGWHGTSGKNAKPSSSDATKRTGDAKPVSPPATTSSEPAAKPASPPEIHVINVDDSAATAKP